MLRRRGKDKEDALKKLRERYPGFDQALVSLAVTRGDCAETPREVTQYYKEQCELFGFDEKTFQPEENRPERT